MLLYCSSRILPCARILLARSTSTHACSHGALAPHLRCRSYIRCAGTSSWLSQQSHPRLSSVQSKSLRLSASKRGTVSKKAESNNQVDEEEAEAFDDDIDAQQESDFDFDVDELELSELDSSPLIQTGDVLWGDQALQAAQQVLGNDEFDSIELHTFRVNVARKKMDVRLDDLDDYYGSPSLEMIETFSKRFCAQLESVLGVDLAGELDFEVSTPGAERELRLPEDLTRFQGLPMKVQYALEDGTTECKVMDLVSVDEEQGLVVWKLADVKANSPGKGRKLSKKMREQQFSIALSATKNVNLHVDF